MNQPTWPVYIKKFVGRVGNVGNKKFCLWPLRFRGPWPPALPGGLAPKAKWPRDLQLTNLTEPYNVVLWWGAMWALLTLPTR
jgi:hypothetical protein